MAKTYKIEVRETLSRVVEVTAETEYEAIFAVEDMHRKGEIILTADDFVEVDVLNSEEKENE